MKNKKGFTLTELLAVIIILGLIMVIVIPALVKKFSDTKEDKCKIYTETVEKALLTYADIELPLNANETVEVTLQYLVDAEYLDKYDVEGSNYKISEGITIPVDTSIKIQKNNGEVTLFDHNDGNGNLQLTFSVGGSNKNCTKNGCS